MGDACYPDTWSHSDMLDGHYNSIKIGDCDRSESLTFHKHQDCTIFTRTGVNLVTASSKMFTLTAQNVAKDILMVASSLIAIEINLQHISRIINPWLDDW